MAAIKHKVRCTVCGDGVSIAGNCVAEHSHKYTGAKVICYGSFMPLLLYQGVYQVGNIMYISRHRQPWGELAEEEYDEPPGDA
jgi:hypothetical protein